MPCCLVPPVPRLTCYVLGCPPPACLPADSLMAAFRAAAVTELTKRLQASLAAVASQTAGEAHRQMDLQVGCGPKCSGTYRGSSPSCCLWQSLRGIF